MTRAGKVYSQTGMVHEYDVATDRWSERAPLPTPRSDLAVAVAGNRIYAIGGRESDGRASVCVEEYDAVRNRWVKKAGMPSARCHLAVAAAGAAIVAIGGRENPLALERYDPALDSWTRLDPLKTPKPNPFAVSVGGKVFVLGGTEGGKEDYAQFEEYDPATGRWTRRTPMPTARTDIALAVHNRRIYVMGGWKSGGLTDRVECFDPATDRWSEYASLPRPRSFAGAAAIRGRIYVVSGSVYQPDGSLSPVDDVDATVPPEKTV